MDIRTLSVRGIEWTGINPDQRFDTISDKVTKTNSFDEIADVDPRGRGKVPRTAGPAPTTVAFPTSLWEAEGPKDSAKRT